MSSQNTVTIENQTFRVEIADTPAKRQQGLSGKRALTENSGMLFIFPNQDYHGIWMKDMLFPIDIVWIDQGKVVDFVENAPLPTSQSLDTLPIYRPSAPAQYVLEFPANTLNRYRIQRGSKVIIKDVPSPKE